MNPDRVLVIGYGNVMRGDDAVGPLVADALRDDTRLTGARIIACHQLTPELAADVRTAELVVLVDARADERAPGLVTVDAVEPSHSTSPGSHRLAAWELAGLARAAFGVAPDMRIVSVGAASFGVGDELSADVAAAVPAVIDAVVGLVAPAAGEAPPAPDAVGRSDSAAGGA